MASLLKLSAILLTWVKQSTSVPLRQISHTLFPLILISISIFNSASICWTTTGARLFKGKLVFHSRLLELLHIPWLFLDLQGTFWVWTICHKEFEVLLAQLCLTLCDPMNYSLPGSSVHEILQSRILEWEGIPFSSDFSRPRDWNELPCIAGRYFTVWAK